MIQRIFNQLKKDFKHVSWAIIFMVAYFVVLQFVFGTCCPLQFITGYPCPGCGTTRAGLALLRLDFKEAWRMNPTIYFLIILAVIFFCERYISTKNSYKITYIWATFMIIFALIFYFWRMYMFYPDVAPMTYYQHNILAMIKQML